MIQKRRLAKRKAKEISGEDVPASKDPSGRDAETLTVLRMGEKSPFGAPLLGDYLGNNWGIAGNFWGITGEYLGIN